jgi:hypothetical protein
MVADPRRHAVRQIFQELDRLQAVLDVKREHHFLNGPMTAADRLARQIKNFKPSVAEVAERGIDVTKLMGRLSAHSRRIEQLSDALQHLHNERGNETARARAVRVRDAKSNAKKEERR